MTKYRNELVNHPRVSFIHVSQDTKVESATLWAKNEKFPWLTVLPQDVKSSGLERFKGKNGIPFFALVTADGKTVEAGNNANTVFDRARKL